MNHEDLKTLHQLAVKATSLLNERAYTEALNLAVEIRALPPHYIVTNTLAGLLIDLGNLTANDPLIKEGIDLLNEDLHKLLKDDDYAAHAQYNLGNGYYARFLQARKVDSRANLFRSTFLDEAIHNYREALKHENLSPILEPEIHVNLGNSYDYEGRFYEAMECYGYALRIQPNHGMALGNQGHALFRYASLSQGREASFLHEAYNNLGDALDLNITPEASRGFTTDREMIRARFEKPEFLEKPLTKPQLCIPAGPDIERSLIEYCIKNKLYLNVCNYCQKCDLAIGDPIAIKSMIIKMGDQHTNLNASNDPFLRTSGYLNEIKQDYITARFLLFISQYKNLELGFVDRKVGIIDTLDYSMHNIYVHLVKVAFQQFYNLFDKISHFINDYLAIGLKKRKVSFNRIWYERAKNPRVQKNILDTKNIGFNALFKIHKDFQVGPYKSLRYMRNVLTHHFMKVKLFGQFKSGHEMSEEMLAQRTLDLARIARNAVIYLLDGVYIEEYKKAKETQSILPHLTALFLPDDLKSNR